ncbi:hypothetical protein [Pantoea dispersa]
MHEKFEADISDDVSDDSEEEDSSMIRAVFYNEALKGEEVKSMRLCEQFYVNRDNVDTDNDDSEWES